MHGRSGFASTRWLAALAMTAVLLSGCSAWLIQRQAPATLVSSSKTPPNVRVTLQDSSKVEVYQAAVNGDSLVGFSTQPRAKTWGVPGPPANRVVVALSDIRAIEVHRIHEGRTLLFLAGLVVVAAGLAAAAMVASMESW